MAKPTDAEKAERDRRTTDVGLFNFGDAYLICGKTLAAQKISGLHFADPIHYQLYHSIELFLKAYLRNRGVSAHDLATQFSHNLTRLKDAAIGHGLTLESKDIARIEYLQDHQSVIEARYIVTGYKSLVPLEAVLGMSERIRSAVQDQLISAGVTLRPGPLLPDVKFDTAHRTFPQFSEDT